MPGQEVEYTEEIAITVIEGKADDPRRGICL
jgi:hypothetical protein